LVTFTFNQFVLGFLQLLLDLIT